MQPERAVQSRHLELGLVAIAASVMASVPLAAEGVATLAPIAVAPLAIVYGAASLLGWLLIHECIHDKLFRNGVANRTAGRLLAILLGCPFAMLRAGHLIHHAESHMKATPGGSFGPGTAPVDAAPLQGGREPRRRPRHRAVYFAGVFGGFHLLGMIAPLVVALPGAPRLIRRLRPARSTEGIFLKWMARDLWQVRLDAALSAGFLAVAVLVSGAAICALAVLVLVKAAVISYHDNLYHHGVPEAAPHAAHNVAMPRALGRLLLHSNYHQVHHAFPTASWRELPALAERSGHAFTIGLGAALGSQLSGPADPATAEPKRAHGP